MTSANVNRRRHPAIPALLASAALACTIAGCGGLAGPATAAPTSNPSAAPTAAAAGRLHLIAEPAYDYRRAELAYWVDGRRIEGESIDQDVEIIVDRELPPGGMQVEKNGRLCDGVVAIVSNVESDVLLDFGLGDAGDEVCELFATDTHPPGSIDHPELPLTAAIGATLPFGVRSLFVVRSLDDPAASPIAEVAVNDPPYEAAQIVVDPGRYEVSVLVGGVVLARDTLDLERGEDRIALLRVLPPDVPRDCEEIPRAICERAIDAGYAWGLYPGGRQYVTAARLSPSKYMSCGTGLQSPLFDIAFALENPKSEAEVTVGRYEDGRFTACTY